MSSKKKKIIKKEKLFFKKHEQDILLLSIPLILLVILGILSQLTIYTNNSLTKQEVVNNSAQLKVNDYSYFAKPIEPPITADAAIIMDSNSKVTTFAKNPTLRFSMASTTKIMTSLVALEHYSLSDVLTVQRSNVEGVNVGFEVGEQIFFEDVLYAMMLPSGNDAAYLIADNYPGGMEAFVNEMNEKARALYLPNTHYADPAGLNDDGNYTTVTDLARLASFAITHPELSKIIGTKNRIITNVQGTKTYQLENLNKLLGIYGVTGGKTGYTEGAGGVLVTSAVTNGHTFIVVVMKSEDRFADTQILLSYILTDISYFSPKSFNLKTQ